MSSSRSERTRVSIRGGGVLVSLRRPSTKPNVRSATKTETALPVSDSSRVRWRRASVTALSPAGAAASRLATVASSSRSRRAVHSRLRPTGVPTGGGPRSPRPRLPAPLRERRGAGRAGPRPRGGRRRGAPGDPDRGSPPSRRRGCRGASPSSGRRASGPPRAPRRPCSGRGPGSRRRGGPARGGRGCAGAAASATTTTTSGPLASSSSATRSSGENALRLYVPGRSTTSAGSPSISNVPVRLSTVTPG